MNTNDNTVEATKDETLTFEMPKVKSFAELEAELKEQEEKANALRMQMALAKEKEKKGDFDSLNEIIGLLQNKYGNDLVDFIQNQFGIKPTTIVATIRGEVVLETDKDLLEFEKFKEIYRKGYYADQDKVFNPKGEEVSSMIVGFAHVPEKKFSMAVNTYKELYYKFK